MRVHELMPKFAELLSMFSSLEVLCLAMDCNFDAARDQIFPAIATNTYLPALSKLELHTMPLNEHDLVTFLSRHKDTIKHAIVPAFARLGLIGLSHDVVERIGRTMAERDIKVKIELGEA